MPLLAPRVSRSPRLEGGTSVTLAIDALIRTRLCWDCRSPNRSRLRWGVGMRIPNRTRSMAVPGRRSDVRSFVYRTRRGPRREQITVNGTWPAPQPGSGVGEWQRRVFHMSDAVGLRVFVRHCCVGRSGAVVACSSDSSSTRCVPFIRWVPVPAGRDLAGGPLVSPLRTVVSRR
jgi:hypothetical protein